MKNNSMTKSFDDIALVLQGGGALGSYQAGAFNALAAQDIEPTWIAGISIGALNTAIIAGNPPEKRIEMLKGFWDTICTSAKQQPIDNLFNYWSSYMGSNRKVINGISANNTMMKGQKGFFVPKFLNLGSLVFSQFQKGMPDTLSYYDTSTLKETLLKFANFDLINNVENGGMRVSLGVVNVRTGEFSYFDNTKDTLRPEHFMASGALPPSFPAVEIDGEYYWDGGLVSNTPILEIIQQNKGKKTLVFQVDLWSSEGDLPHCFDDISSRTKDIQFSSRDTIVNKAIEENNEHAKMIASLLEHIPAHLRQDTQLFENASMKAQPTEIVVHHITYQQKPHEGSSKDYEFSFATMCDHWNCGINDMQNIFSTDKYCSISHLIENKNITKEDEKNHIVNSITEAVKENDVYSIKKPLDTIQTLYIHDNINANIYRHNKNQLAQRVEKLRNFGSKMVYNKR